MPSDSPSSPSHRSSLATLAAVLLSISLVVLWGWIGIQDLSAQSIISGQGREVLSALKIWALDHNDNYTDSDLGEKATANMAFRELFKAELLFDERPFGAPRSPFIPDGDVGSAPDCHKALQPGENHWMLVACLSTKSPGRTPLFFENALDTSWPPKWRPGFFMPHVRGRSWRGGKIQVYLNDNSSFLVPLKKQGDYLTLPDDVLEGLPSLKVLDIEERR